MSNEKGGNPDFTKREAEIITQTMLEMSYKGRFSKLVANVLTKLGYNFEEDDDFGSE